MAEERHYNPDFNLCHGENGQNFLQTCNQQEQFDMRNELEQANVDSTRSEIKNSTTQYDSSSSGLVFMVPFL